MTGATSERFVRQRSWHTASTFPDPNVRSSAALRVGKYTPPANAALLPLSFGSLRRKYLVRIAEAVHVLGGFLRRFARVLDELCIDLNRFQVAVAEPGGHGQQFTHIFGTPYLFGGISIAEAMTLYIRNPSPLSQFLEHPEEVFLDAAGGRWE